MIGIVMCFALVVVPIIIFWSEHRREIRHLTRNQPVENESDEPVGWQCTEYSQRLLEEKMVDAGIMSIVEMTTCEDAKCKNCRPTHNAINEKFRAERALQNDGARKAYANNLLSANQIRPLDSFLDYFKCEVCEAHVDYYDELTVDDMGLSLVIAPKMHHQCRAAPDAPLARQRPTPLKEMYESRSDSRI